ncbi:hypothetical protein CY34DRAFT_810285 [Suillus luteus UH-Slu-Lm8-n1]|uniref:Uncharacterized protein n=1 Tax=Suillus luteus UH-Slu-Lm8-n1 TaxID=930992 RepID=A0A0D0A7B6_9AGAM|nr:hypothetical protein CY34DRAFT_810285 [Suillus luteus UH-Slu-Lm8-n1]
MLHQQVDRGNCHIPNLPLMLIRDQGEPRVCAIHSFPFNVAQIDEVSQTNELLGIWVARFRDHFILVCMLKQRNSQTCIISCLGHVYRVSLYFSTGYERLLAAKRSEWLTKCKCGRAVH